MKHPKAELYIEIGFAPSRTVPDEIPLSRAKVEHTIQYKTSLDAKRAADKLIENCSRITNIGLFHIALEHL